MASERILIVDDSPEILTAIRRLLAREGYDVRVASGGGEGIEAARTFEPHCILLDYLMPDMNGEEVVARIRAFDSLTQIVLVTGHGDSLPGREMMRRLDIQGYHRKGDDVEHLLLSVDSALKAHRHLERIAHQSRAMRLVLDSSALVHRLLPVPELCQLALDRLEALLGGSGPPERAVLATLERDGELVLRAQVGWPTPLRRPEELPAAVRASMAQTSRSGGLSTADGFVTVPLSVADRRIGVMATHRTSGAADLSEPLLLFATQVALAIENVRLHEMATVDSLTGLRSRAHFLDRLDEWLRLSVRQQQPLSLILLDLDGLKRINDDLGHGAGDRALALVGRSVRDVIRETDIGGRYGGDEVVVLTPQTGPRGAAVLAERLRAAVAAVRLEVDGAPVALTASVGYGGFEAPALDGRSWRSRPRRSWKRLAERLIADIDAALYAAKRAGRDRVVGAGDCGQLGGELLDLTD